MYDHSEFNDDGTFLFWHVHFDESLDRGVYRYELKDGIIPVVKEGMESHSHYSYVFSGNIATLTPYHHATEDGDAEHGDSADHAISIRVDEEAWPERSDALARLNADTFSDGVKCFQMRL